jgi:hypothetical protein
MSPDHHILTFRPIWQSVSQLSDRVSPKLVLTMHNADSAAAARWLRLHFNRVPMPDPAFGGPVPTGTLGKTSFPSKRQVTHGDRTHELPAERAGFDPRASGTWTRPMRRTRLARAFLDETSGSQPRLSATNTLCYSEFTAVTGYCTTKWSDGVTLYT